jgi:hypothetical protein
MSIGNLSDEFIDFDFVGLSFEPVLRMPLTLKGAKNRFPIKLPSRSITVGFSQRCITQIYRDFSPSILGYA